MENSTDNASLSMTESATLSNKALKKQLKAQKREEECFHKEEEKEKMAIKPTSQPDPNEYYENRVKFLDEQKADGINPYPHKFDVTMTIVEFIRTYGGLNNGECLEDVPISMAGRIMRKRQSSSKLLFYDLHGDGAKVQVVADTRTSELEEHDFFKFHSSVNCFDIVGVTGFPGKTKRGDLSIFPKSFAVSSHCLRVMPIQKVGPSRSENANVNKSQVWVPGNTRTPELYILNDVETRYSLRFLDLMLNGEVREVFKIRSKVITYIRKFLDNLDFLEIETPIMNRIPGGASPFVTHHNDLNMKLYLRTMPDHYLKQLLVGGLNRVYEVGRQFSNEGIDLTHNPEFTTCKFYMAYADYNDLLQMTEKMLSEMVKVLTGSFIIKCHSNDSDKELIEIDFTPPFRRINAIEELEKVTNLSIPQDLASDEANKYLMDACAKYDVKCPPPQTTARLLEKLVGHFLEETCVNPTFIMDYPELISPSAKCHRSKPGLTEYFKLFVNKHELCNACTELNDPMVQQRRIAERKDPQSGDGIMVLDETSMALEHGLPPSASCGLSIDYLAMLVTDSQSIQEVLLFPAMKPQFEPSADENHNLSSASMPSSLRIIVVGDIHEDWKLEHDTKAIRFLQPDLVLFTGDFGNENVELVKGISKLNLPKGAILGNHDSWSTSKFSKKVKDGVQVQLECLGDAHVGYDHLDFPPLKLSVVGGRPFSCGGNQIFRKKLITARYGVHNMEESAEKIYKAALRTPKENSIILLSHNGPGGLGSGKDDICGIDWEPEGGDFGDPDLAQAILQLKETTNYSIPLVVFGHMHKELAYGGSRKMIAMDADNTMYLNAAIVPRVKYPSSGGSIRAFTVVEFSNGKITKVTETWVSIVDDKASLEEEHLLFSSN